MNTMRTFRCPRDIVWGRGSIAYLEKISPQKVLIVTDREMTKLGVTGKAQIYLKKGGSQVKVFDEVEPEPSIHTVMRMVADHKNFDPTAIVGLGGGSALDASKAFRIFYEHPQLTFQDVRTLEVPPKVSIPPFKKTTHVTISSTSGTGSDVSYGSIITDPAIPAKCPILDPEIIPDKAIVDPDIAATMPPEVLADSGLDALTHAMESYVNVRANDFSRGLSLQAITLIMRYLPLAFLENDPVAKEHMHYAATIAGIAFSNSANGICHAIADKVGAAFKLTHGRANAIALPFTIHYNSTVVGDLYTRIARAIGHRGDDRLQAVDYLLQRIREVQKQLRVQSCYREAGIAENAYYSKIKDFSTRAFTFRPTLLNPRKPTMEELESLFLACYQGNDHLP